MDYKLAQHVIGNNNFFLIKNSKVFESLLDFMLWETVWTEVKVSPSVNKLIFNFWIMYQFL